MEKERKKEEEDKEKLSHFAFRGIKSLEPVSVAVSNRREREKEIGKRESGLSFTFYKGPGSIGVDPAGPGQRRERERALHTTIMSGGMVSVLYRVTSF